LIRKEAMEIILNYAKAHPIVSANGFISRDLFEIKDKKTNFYMIGSMGLASSIGLGVALKNPKKTVFVFDGDGNILMNLGSLVTIGSLKPKNFVHVIFDNNIHESTGGQPTNISKINFKKICDAVNYKTFQITTKSKLIQSLKNLEKLSGPILFHVKISSSKTKSKRMTIHPKTIRDRFTNSIR
jgi:thiamine pyrophosphate-dependent acetolactate synthase large subunit-like protein